MTDISQSIALKVAQQATRQLCIWVGAVTPVEPDNIAEGQKIIEDAKSLLDWPSEKTKPQVLQLIFDTIRLSASSSAQESSIQRTPAYWPSQAIADIDPLIPYPLAAEDTSLMQQLRDELKTSLDNMSAADWQNFSLLMLILEKYGFCISYGKPDIAFFDLVKMTAAVATALAKNPSAETLQLVAGDLSGIQKFIYTIASDGALKSLRARSFLLELVTEEVVQQLLEKLVLPRTSVIYSGGGNLYLLVPDTEEISDEVENIRNQFNDWLLQEYQGKVFLGLVSHSFPTKDIATSAFSSHWEGAIKRLSKQKSQKFYRQLSQLLDQKDAHEPCKVCHRDDTKNLESLSDDGVNACPTCHTMFNVGSKLFKVEAIVRSHNPAIAKELTQSLKIKIGDRTTYYHLFDNPKTIPNEPQSVYLINNWTVDLYKFPHFDNPTLLLLGNYGQVSKEESGFITAAEMANRSQGIKRVGHLRMDVDRLGQIFASGLGNKYTLPRLSGLSRQLSYFFKVYLNSIAKHRQANLPSTVQQLTQTPRNNLLFIYAGGDDLFVSGTWNETVEFAFDVYQSFRAYTGHNPDITLSAGVTLNGPKYPLYQSADESGKFEKAAKGNGRDSLSLFGQVFKWQEWLGRTEVNISEIPSITPSLRTYINNNAPLRLYGILPFVTELNSNFRVSLPRSFVQNLLNTAKLQEQEIKALKEADPEQVRAIRYFLHLPKVAYTLARLPKSIRAAPEFDFNAVSTSLKSPYNAPYFRAIATWLDLLNRSSSTTPDQNGNKARESTRPTQASKK